MELETKLPEFCPSHPPCVVCSRKGSGVYYGVNSCHACKVFFARWSSRNGVRKSRCKGTCESHEGKKWCVSCRYKKCLEMGMSKNGSQLGRCNSAHRANVTEQVKRLQLQSKMKSDGTLVSIDEHGQNMDDLVSMLTNTQLTFVPNSTERYESALASEKEYLDKKKIEFEVFGYNKHVSHQEYHEFYAQTGLDIDGRREVVARLLPFIQTSIENFVKFAQNVPGFKHLPQKDQTKLLQVSSLECNLFLFYPLFNTEEGITVHPYASDIIMHISDMFGICESSNVGSFDEFCTLIERVRRLDLTVEESIMCAALSLLNGDVCMGQFASKTLSDGVDYVVEILYCEISKNHDPEENTFAKLISILTELRQFHSMQMENMKIFIQSCFDIGNTEALTELFMKDNS